LLPNVLTFFVNPVAKTSIYITCLLYLVMDDFKSNGTKNEIKILCNITISAVISEKELLSSVCNIIFIIISAQSIFHISNPHL